MKIEPKKDLKEFEQAATYLDPPLKVHLCSKSGGASGRVTILCPCRLGSNPRTYLAFWVQNRC